MSSHHAPVGCAAHKAGRTGSRVSWPCHDRAVRRLSLSATARACQPSRHSRTHHCDAAKRDGRHSGLRARSEEHTSELQSLMRSSYAVFCLKKKTNTTMHLPTCDHNM